MSDEDRTCPHSVCTCVPQAGARYCSGHCEAEVEGGRLQDGPCHCGHLGCGHADRGPEPAQP